MHTDSIFLLLLFSPFFSHTCTNRHTVSHMLTHAHTSTLTYIDRHTNTYGSERRPERCDESNECSSTTTTVVVVSIHYRSHWEREPAAYAISTRSDEIIFRSSPWGRTETLEVKTIDIRCSVALESGFTSKIRIIEMYWRAGGSFKCSSKQIILISFQKWKRKLMEFQHKNFKKIQWGFCGSPWIFSRGLRWC